MSEELKYISPKRFYEVFQEISDHLYDKIFEMKDREIFYDRQKWINRHTVWNTYKKNSEFEKDLIYNGDIETVAILISQIVIFNRIIKERSEGEFNLPSGEVPLYLKQVNEKNRDNFDISTGRLIKKWSKKNKGKIQESIKGRK
tara:strand:+ start:108 stop:539 length:432 start_codon:yes stop_codon:yes gene_type:complete